MSELNKLANELIQKNHLPSMSIAVWKEGRLSTGAAGTLNVDTGVKATPDSLFQIGSITKVMTASLIMRLVDESRLSIDDPVSKYLPDFSLADRHRASKITIKHLLNHSNGIAGDYFWNDRRATGPLLARFVDRCSHLPVNYPAGEWFSYSNTGYAILGRIVEVLSGSSWESEIERRIFDPLGMSNSICRPADLLGYRAAAGHNANTAGRGEWRTVEDKFLSLSMAPAGSTLMMSAADLLLFACSFLESNRYNDVVLSKQNRLRMTKPTIIVPTVPHAEASEHLGLGWFVGHHHQTNLRYLFHGGGGAGQKSMLRVYPRMQAAFCVLINSGDVRALHTLTRFFTKMVTGTEERAPHEWLNADHIRKSQIHRLKGVFSNSLDRFIIGFESDKLVLSVESTNPNMHLAKTEFKHVGNDVFMACDVSGALTSEMPLIFKDRCANGVPQKLYLGRRLLQRIS